MLRVFVFTLFTLRLSAAIAFTAIWEVRPSVGSDSNGGCFDPAVTSPGTDYSQQNAAQYNFTDLVIGATTTNVTSASHSFVAADVGNCMHISAGSGFTTGWYEILSVATGVATLDRSAGTTLSTGGTWFEGGALLSTTQLNTNMQAGNSAWIKASGTISISSTYTVNFGNKGGVNNFITGYTSTRGDGGQVTITQGSALNPTVNVNVFGLQFQNFIINCNSNSGSGGIDLENSVQGYNLLVENCDGNPGVLFNNNGAACYFCTVSGQNTSIAISMASPVGLCYACGVYGGTSAVGISGGGNSVACIFCVAANMSGGTADGFNNLFQSTNNQFIVMNSVSYNNGRDGFRITGQSGNDGNFVILNSIAYGNAEYGINYVSSGVITTLTGTNQLINHNAYGANTTANLNNLSAGTGDVTLGSNPFVACGSSPPNCSLTAGGITALGGMGTPGAFLAGTSHLDIGAYQHTASSSSFTRGAAIIQ